MNNTEEDNKTTRNENQGSVTHDQKTNPLGIKLVAWGCFFYPLLVLLPVFYTFATKFKSLDELTKFLLGGIVWGFTIVIFIWIVFLIITSIISVLVGIALLKRSKLAYMITLFVSLFLVAIQLIVFYVNREFKLEVFSLLSVWCVVVIALLISYRKLY